MRNIALLTALVFSFSILAQAEVELYPLFCDNAVLQRGVPLPVFGTAAEGEEVTASLDGKTMKTNAKDGKWKVHFSPKPAGGPYTLTVKGKENQVAAENILIGDVWLCTGQSNMAGPLRGYVAKAPEILKGHPGDFRNDRIRLMKFAKTVADTPQGMPPLAEGFETWRICEPEAALDFSATGYFFGVNLQPHIDVPVGLIQTCVGGTPAEAWTPRDVLEGNPKYQDILAMWQEIFADYPSKKEKYEARLAAWEKGGKRGKAPKLPKLGPDNHRQPDALYNGMIAPILPFPIKGAVWYQGEGNARTYERAIEYRSLLPDMIESWRARWDLGDFPFIWVQLAPFGKITEAPQDKPWSWMRETMDKMQGAVPNSGMACIIDGGSQSDVHPPYKEMAGSRLALQVRRVAYGQDIVASGPVLKRSKRKGGKIKLPFLKRSRRKVGKIKLTFENVGDGLEQHALVLDAGQVKVRGDRLVGFTMCGDDHVFVRAEAKITGKNTVEIWSENVEKPVAVRYAWAEFPLANLYNSAGLPTGPFRTDNFPPPVTEQ